MSHWNHRLVDMSVLNGGETWIELCEVFYNEDGSLFVHASPCTGSETVDGLRETLQRMLAACDLPILKYEDFPPEPTEED